MTRTHFHSSHLTRVLADLVGMDALAGHDAFAEKLGQWIQVSGAIALRAAHGAGAVPHAQPVAQAAGQTAGQTDIAAHFAQVRSALEQTLSNATSSTPQTKPGNTRSALHGSRATNTGLPGRAMPWPKKDVPLEIAGAYAPYLRYYQTQQREMDLKVKPLRAQVREVVGSASAPLGQLAALDAAMETLLAERESLLLAKVPTLMEERFKQLRTAHQEALLRAQQDDRTELWTQPGGWLARFCTELQNVLLAELDLRLQPTVGLLEALHNET